MRTAQAKKGSTDCPSVPTQEGKTNEDLRSKELGSDLIDRQSCPEKVLEPASLAVVGPSILWSHGSQSVG